MFPEGEPIGFLLKSIHDNIDRAVNSNLKPHDLTFSQMRLMMFLYRCGDDTPSQKEVEEYLQVAHPTVVGLLQRLEAKGLVRCAFDSQDRRIKSVYLTERGQREAGEARRRRQQMERTITAEMTPEDVSVLRGLLKKVLKNVRKQNGGQECERA